MMTESAVDILLVEDNPNDIELAVYAFKKNNIEDRVQIVRNGVEALDYIFRTNHYSERRKQDDPKIILLDLKLPKIDGLEIVKRVKNDEHTKKIPIIILTTSKESSDVAASYLYGANSYIVKPVDFNEFANAIQTIVNYWLMLNHYSAKE